MGLEEIFDRGIGDEEGSGVPQSKRFFGKFVGYARNTADPEERGRIVFFCPEVMGDIDSEEFWLHWAMPCFPVGGAMNAGSFVPAADQSDILDDGEELDVDADPEAPIVAAALTDPRRDVCYWLEFREGNPQYPIYVGCFYPDPNQAPLMTPKAARGVQDETTLPPTGTAQATVNQVLIDTANSTCSTPEEGTIREASPENDATTGKNRMYKSPSGHLVEIDDTPDAERIRVYHRTGSYMELNPAGTLVTKVVGSISTFVDFDLTEAIQGSHIQVVTGSSRLQVGGPRSELYQGARDAIYQNFVRECYLVEKYERVVGRMQAIYGAYALDCLGDVEIGSGGSMALSAMESFGAFGLSEAGMGCPSGTKLYGSLGPELAVSQIVGGTTWAAALVPVTNTLNGVITALVTGTAAQNAAAIKALGAAVTIYINALLVTLNANLTIHKVSLV